MTGTKGAQIQSMFDQLAPKYDLMNRVMTLGQDQRWRRFVVDRAGLPARARVLDLASGTGDIAFEMVRRDPAATVFAADFSLGMLRRGKTRKGGDTVHWVSCDAQQLPFESGCFDAVTFGYLLRNVEDINRCLKEIHRVLKPGGRIVCLDTTPPPKGLVGAMVRGYLKFGLPLMGRLLAGDRASYQYLSQSTMGFLESEALKALFQEQGFAEVAYRFFMMKTVAVHWGTKSV